MVRGGDASLCTRCGSPLRPAVDAFCPSCRHPVAWDAGGNVLPVDGGWLPASDGGPATAVSAPGPPLPEPSVPSHSERPRIQVSPQELTLAPGQPDSTVQVRVGNASEVVEEFVVELSGGPDWLAVAPAEVRLLPGAAETVSLRLHPVASGAITAGSQAVQVLVRSVLRPDAVSSAPITLVVPGQEGLLTLSVEPEVLRGGGSGRLRLTLTQTGNQPLSVALRGTEAEGVAAFTFSPPTIQLPPYGSAAVTATVTAPRPLRGQTATRRLTLHAEAGSRSADATATLVQEPAISSGALTALRVLLTILGGLLILSGSRGVWTTAPFVGRGTQWTYHDYSEVAFGLDLLSPGELGVDVPSALVSAGAVTSLFGLLAILGLLGARGGFTRFASALALLSVVAFLAVLAVTTGVGIGRGAWTALLGSALAFTGGLWARR